MPRDATRDHLARLYAANADPWGHLTRPYERAKYDATLQAAGDGPFALALEVGCGNGALALRLADRARRLIAVEMIADAAKAARERLAHLGHVRIVEGAAPEALPPLAPDLIVLSEVLYFLTVPEIGRLAGWIRAHAAPGCRLVAVNWTGETGETLSGAQAARILRDGLAEWRGSHRAFDGFAIDVLDAPGG
ncbi:type 12 methyltransferase [Oceaniovalibus guishaninsula JLT2003]|uniref:Type 12 methyltransferase n=1 Tax=Oceaniovalibus guishaninsula JLT2003 TaxID=1231392 RepID=K2HJA3_9RHOB|nr:SAM-dependent methyltransferase [Oceaniovalibus guishaninsula]EKE43079.1 type 12 methyltransferase [Oceaniovalibus guishaninsula JLT2003]